MLNKKTIISIALSLGLLAGCGSKANGDATSTTSTLSGQVSAAGSSALLPLVQEAADEFMKENPDVVISANGGGSGEGLKQVAEGSIDIGNSDVFAEDKLDKDKASTLVDHQVALVAMAAVVNKDLGVKDLITQQLIDIFTGKVTNWNEVGGPDEKILLVTRPSSSGTRATFTKYALNGTSEVENKSLETDDSGTLVQTVSDNKGAIGYVAFSYLSSSDKLQAIAIDGHEASLENVYDGTYKVWSYEHMYTKGEAKDPAKSFIDFMMSDKFADQVEKLGYGVTSKLSDTAKANH